MRRRTLVILALVAVLTVMIVAPVSAGADKPISGKIELTLVLFPCTNTDPPPPDPENPFLTWTGTVVVDGTTYGWADFPLPVEDPPVLPNDRFFYFEEHWTIFTLEGEEDPVADPTLACDSSRVVLEGTNTGWGSPGLTGKADGEVTWADPEGPFAHVAAESGMFWRGKVLGNEIFPGAQFKATLHIFPLT